MYWTDLSLCFVLNTLLKFWPKFPNWTFLWKGPYKTNLLQVYFGALAQINGENVARILLFLSAKTVNCKGKSQSINWNWNYKA